MAAVATPPMLTARMVTEESALQPSRSAGSPYTGAVRAIDLEAAATAEPGARLGRLTPRVRGETAGPV